MHAKAYEQDRKRSVAKRKKQQEKEEKDRKKQWVKKGCGHKPIKMFGFFKDQDCSSTSRKSDQTTTKKVEPVKSSSTNSDYVASQVISTSALNSPSAKLASYSSSIEITKVVKGKDELNDTLSTQNSNSDTSEGGEDDKDLTDINVQDIEFQEDLTDINVQDIEGQEDSTDINVQDVEGQEEDIEVDDKFVCQGCGNKGKECHQYKYGSWIVQEAISFFHENEPDKITESDVKHNMKYAYNKQLNFDCYKETYKYDSNCWYDFSPCLEKGGVEYGLKVVQNQQIFFHLEKRREGGIAGRTQRNRATAVYDFGPLLEDNEFY